MINMNNKEIGNKIKSRRKELNLTLQAVASRVGVAISTIQRYENGSISQCKLPVLESIAKALNVNPVWLIRNDAPMLIDASPNANLNPQNSIDTSINIVYSDFSSEFNLSNDEKQRLESISIRLKKIMQERNLRQVDLLELLKPICKKYNIKINKSDISQYLSGKVKPGQEKLSMLGMALNVSESWLMGYDSPMERPNNVIYDSEYNFSEEEKILISDLRKLNNIGKNKVYTYAKDLLDNPKFVNAPCVTKDEISATLCVSEEKEPYLFAAHNDGIDEETNRANIEKIKDFYNNNLKGKNKSK